VDRFGEDMSRELLSEFIYHLDADRSMKLGHAPDDVQAWLEDLGLPIDIRRFLQWDWPQTNSYIRHIALMSSENIIKDEYTSALLPYKFLHLGSAPNGDFFVLDISTDPCRPGFITHEEYCEKNPRVVFQPIARSFESLLYRLVEGRYVPKDYYAAREFNEFLEQERQHTKP
jgi:hypothetical protein